MSASDDLSMVAVQGPTSEEVLNKCPAPIVRLLETKKKQQGVFGNNMFATKTGYTGEMGFEVILPHDQALNLWNNAIEGGAKPIGLGARDTLRMEMGYCLYGNDIDDKTTPFEANLMWITNLKKEFIGKEKVLSSIENSSKTMINFKMIERGIPRNGYEIKNEKGVKIGFVTSGTFSPSNKVGLGIGYINDSYKMSDKIFISIRNKLVKAEIIKLPINHG